MWRMRPNCWKYPWKFYVVILCNNVTDTESWSRAHIRTMWSPDTGHVIVWIYWFLCRTLFNKLCY
jgi:hypothetical protein